MDPIFKRQVARIESGRRIGDAQDELASEEPLEIRVGGEPLAALMRTPGEDLALCAGFLLTEGIIESPAQIGAIEACEGEGGEEAGNVLNVSLAGGAQFDSKAHARQFYASASCGLCGKATIDSIRLRAPALRAEWTIDAKILLGFPDALRAAQPLFERTGSIHAAGLFAQDGRLAGSAEDVGRHNAVDKAIGRAALEGRWPLSDLALMVSGRASFEIAQKALMAGIGLVAAVSGVTALAAGLAEESGMTLAGFVRGGAMTIYSGDWRIRLGPDDGQPMKNRDQAPPARMREKP